MIVPGNGKSLSVYIGWDPREASAYAVARHSMSRNAFRVPTHIRGLVLDDLKAAGLYRRPTEWRPGNADGASTMWDTISDAPMSTEFACSRFLVPHLARRGWALFLDCDMLVRSDIAPLYQRLQQSADYAVMCVKHHHDPPAGIKMDGQLQTRYARKNWSSVMAFNCDHPSNEALTVEIVNSLPGRDLHRFCWLRDDEIGELPPEWNWLVGHSDPTIDPAIVHFTEGTPAMKGYENVPYADEWRRALSEWAA